MYLTLQNIGCVYKKKTLCDYEHEWAVIINEVIMNYAMIQNDLLPKHVLRNMIKEMFFLFHTVTHNGIPRKKIAIFVGNWVHTRMAKDNATVCQPRARSRMFKEEKDRKLRASSCLQGWLEIYKVLRPEARLFRA